MTQVLTVDDSETTRALIRSMLEPEGYTVIEAGDGVQGLVALRATSGPGVVLLDYQMPNMDGAEMLQAVIGEGAPLTHHEYIVISGHAGTFPLDFIDLLRHLSVRVLPKPFARPALLAAVAQAVERLNAPVAEPLPQLPDA